MTKEQKVRSSCEVDNQNGKEGLKNGQLALTENYQQVLEDFMQWLSRLNYAKATIKSRKRELGRFLGWLISQRIMSLEEVRKQHLESYNEYLHSTHLVRQSIESHIGALKVYNKYRAAYDQSPILTTRLAVTKEAMIERVVLTRKEVDLMYKACADDVLGWRDRAIMALYYGCGLRSGEGIHLEVRDINFGTEVLLVRKGKGYKQRYVPLSAGTKKILKEWLSNYKPLLGVKSNLILPRRDGKKIRGAALNKRIKKLANRSEIEKRITLHVLRHSIATHLTENGMELESVAQFLGHSTLQTTIKYIHVDPRI